MNTKLATTVTLAASFALLGAAPAEAAPVAPAKLPTAKQVSAAAGARAVLDYQDTFRGFVQTSSTNCESSRSMRGAVRMREFDIRGPGQDSTDVTVEVFQARTVRVARATMTRARRYVRTCQGKDSTAYTALTPFGTWGQGRVAYRTDWKVAEGEDGVSARELYDTYQYRQGRTVVRIRLTRTDSIGAPRVMPRAQQRPLVKLAVQRALA